MNAIEKSKKIRAESLALFQAAPDTMRAFQTVMSSASKAGELSSSVKELMALAIAIATRCEGCIAHHAEAAFKHGATRQQVAESIAVAVEMGGGPAVVYGGAALAAFDQFAAG
jgi:AhpD family alkylhydroperoxidase